jgi:glutamyl-tRNA synthetase
MIRHATRLAPSPTGALHLGNARTFLLNYLLARTRGWRIILRMEDLDGPRIKPGAATEVLTDLEWLGLEWDDRAMDQSQRGVIYQAALEHLVAIGRAYPCTCSRSDVERAASAPHADEHHVVYPGTCRRRWGSLESALAGKRQAPAFRLLVQETQVEFEDMFAGPQHFEPARDIGDFVIYKANLEASYQLAVVIDDVVRADDLLPSTPRQILLQELLSLTPRPRYWHLPLVVGPDGRRLAKRHGDSRLSHYRAHDVSAHRLLGLLGYWSGLLEERQPTDMAELLERFDIGCIPVKPIVYSAEDEAYLTAGHKG